jgi:cell division protein FtsB
VGLVAHPPTRQWLIRLFGAAALAVLLAYVPYVIYRGDGYVQYRKMKDELEDLERKNDALRLLNRGLRREAKRLRTDPQALGAVARDELGLVKPGEIVIQIEKP